MTDDEKFQIEYEQANEWARHYSTVRMTLVPGFAGLSLAILGFQWNPETGPALPTITLASLIWLFAYVILWLFTALEVREWYYARLIRSRLLGRSTSTAAASTPSSLHGDIRSLMQLCGAAKSVEDRYAGSLSTGIQALTPADLRRPPVWLLRDPVQDLPFWMGTWLTLLVVAGGVWFAVR